MAITQAELDRVRLELETKITTVTVEHVSMAQAIGSHGERFTGIEARFDSKLDARFNAQTVLMTVLGVLILFGDPIRSALGL